VQGVVSEVDAAVLQRSVNHVTPTLQLTLFELGHTYHFNGFDDEKN
jgi:hypothetical protein